MKLSLRDKIILIVIGIALLIFGVYKVLFLPTTEKITNLNNSKEEVKALSCDITPVLKEKNRLKAKEKELIECVDKIMSNDSSPTVTNEEFLVFLGETTTNNSVQVTGFNDLGISEEDGVYTATFDFELRGWASNINKVLKEIDNLGIRTSYGSVSFRQNEDYEYLKRYFDDITELKWFKEPEEEQEKQNSEEQTDENDDYQQELPQETYIPEVIPSVPSEPSISQPTPTIPEPKREEPKKEDKTIDERLNSLLETTAVKNNSYKVVLLANTVGVPMTDKPMFENIPDAENDMFIPYYGIREMRLAVTVRIIMFSEPQYDTSILNRSTESNEVL